MLNIKDAIILALRPNSFFQQPFGYFAILWAFRNFEEFSAYVEQNNVLEELVVEIDTETVMEKTKDYYEAQEEQLEEGKSRDVMEWTEEAVTKEITRILKNTDRLNSILLEMPEEVIPMVLEQHEKQILERVLAVNVLLGVLGSDLHVSPDADEITIIETFSGFAKDFAEQVATEYNVDMPALTRISFTQVDDESLQMEILRDEGKEPQEVPEGPDNSEQV